MDADKFEEYLKDRYQDQIDWYNKKSILNKRLYYAIQIPIIIIGVIVPVSASIAENKWYTIILSAIVAAGIAILKFGRFEEHWHNYRSTCETLKKEKYFYDAKTGDYQHCDDPEQAFVENVENQISQAHTKWDQTVKKVKNNR